MFWLPKKDSVLEEKLKDNFRKDTSEANENLLADSLIQNYDSDTDIVISKNISEAQHSESELEQELDKINKLERTLKKSLNFSKEEFDQHKVKHFDELKSFEADLRKKFSKLFKTSSLNSNSMKSQESPKCSVEEVKSMLLDDVESRLICMEKASGSSKKNSSLNEQSVTSPEQTTKYQIELLQTDYDGLKSFYEQEKAEAFSKCELLAEKLKDCHIVYSNKMA